MRRLILALFILGPLAVGGGCYSSDYLKPLHSFSVAPESPESIFTTGLVQDWPTLREAQVWSSHGRAASACAALQRAGAALQAMGLKFVKTEAVSDDSGQNVVVLAYREAANPPSPLQREYSYLIVHNWFSNPSIKRIDIGPGGPDDMEVSGDFVCMRWNGPHFVLNWRLDRMATEAEIAGIPARGATRPKDSDLDPVPGLPEGMRYMSKDGRFATVLPIEMYTKSPTSIYHQTGPGKWERVQRLEGTERGIFLSR